jgi:hypothetical protein
VQSEELFEPGEYLDAGRPGFFSVLARPHGQAHQESFELRHLPTVVNGLNPFIDTWITQAVFNGPNRRAVNLRDVGLMFADLDTYRAAGLKGKTPEEQAALLCLFCGQEGIPAPSIILFSGRGLQAKWLLSSAVDAVSIFEWNQAQTALVRLLEPFAADTKAKDVSRVLRVDRTINTKSGERVRVVHVTGGIEGCPARYDFEELRALLVKENAQTEPREARRQGSARPALALPHELNLRRLNWYRLYDLRDLWTRRGGVREGSRELTLFWELCFLVRAEPGKASDLWREAESIGSQIDPDWFAKEITEGTFSTLYRKAQEARHGLVVEYHGRLYPPMYTPRNQTLIDLFHITPEEEKGLRTIISHAEKYRRKVEKRRAAGVKPITEALSRTRPWEAEGISRATWYRLHPENETTVSLLLGVDPRGEHIAPQRGEGHTEKRGSKKGIGGNPGGRVRRTHE